MMGVAKKYLFLLTVVLVLISEQNLYAQFFNWTSVGSGTVNGTNGVVNAIVKYNGNLVVAGYFSNAGSMSVNNIALWNGNSWSVLGSGMNDTINALTVFGGNLIAGGKFTTAGGNSIVGIAQWNGSGWSQLGSGLNGRVNAFAVYNGNLIAAGSFNNAGSNIAFWNGSVWMSLGSGLDNTVYTLAILSGNLYAGGKFNYAGTISANKIAEWNGSQWLPLGTGLNDDVYIILPYGNYIVAGGKFTQAGGMNFPYLALWNAGWSNLGFQLDNPVYAMAYYNNSLIVGGSFINVNTGGSSLFVRNICKWDANGCSRMVTGTNQSIRVLYLSDTSLYAGGDFTTAGGDYSNHVSVWSNVPTHYIKGSAKYAGDTAHVHHGVVKAVRMDVSTREVIVIDTGLVGLDGTYTINHGINDSTDVVLFPNDEINDHFVPTYYPSSLSWTTAVKILPSVNLDSININVYRTIPDSLSLSNISGYVYLNFTPVLQSGFPFSKDAIIYAKQGNTYREFAVTDSTEKYTIRGLSPGTYDLIVDRIGYNSASRTVVLGTTNLDTVNFYLDTAGVIGIQNISSITPKNFSLSQNYPNPFNPNTVIRFDIKSRQFVSLNIFNILGQRVEQLVNEQLEPGEYKVNFNAVNLTSGVYFYVLNTGEFTETKKMILIK